MQLDKRFKNKIKGRYQKYTFEVGILDDGPHKDARTGKRGLGGKDVLTTYAGGPRRKVSNESTQTISQVSAANRERLGFNYFKKPFEDQTDEAVKFIKGFFALAGGKPDMKKRVENLLQACVRNPMLRGDYGPNAPLTQKIKGFDRAMIDTAQLFKAIKARAKASGWFK